MPNVVAIVGIFVGYMCGTYLMETAKTLDIFFPALACIAKFRLANGYDMNLHVLVVYKDCCVCERFRGYGNAYGVGWCGGLLYVGLFIAK